MSSTTETRSRGTSMTRSEASASTSGGSRSDVPWYEFHPRQQLSSRTFRQLEEQLYIKKAQLKRQPKQHAAVLIPGSNVQLIKTATLAEMPPLPDRHLIEFKQACMEAAGCYKTPKEAAAEITGVEERLMEAAHATITLTSPAAPEVQQQQLQESPVLADAGGKAQQPKTNLFDELLGNCVFRGM
jgi:hypothetical protein